jgi:hypothetical protein
MSNDATYSIGIDAAFSDDSAIGDLDALTSSLVEAGKKSEAYASAVRRLNSDLEGARAASAAANSALAEGNSRYADLERVAIKAGQAVERAQGKGVFDARAARAAAEAQAALAGYTAQLKPLEDNAAAAALAQSKLQNQLVAVNRTAEQSEKRNALANMRFEKMGQVVQLLPGPLRLVAQSALQAGRANQGLTSVFSSQVAVAALTAAAVLAVAAALIAVTVAAASAFVSFTKYATVQADAQRETALTRLALSALSAESAAAVSAFDKITAATGVGEAGLIALTKQLTEAKVSAANMPAALRAAALAEAALGKGGAAQFVDRIKEGTLSVAEFAAQAQSKLGGVVSARLLGLTAQGERLQRLWSSLFSDLALEPVLAALDTLLSDLERGQPLAEFLRATIGGVFGTIADNAQSAAFAVEAFFLRAAIMATEAYLAIRPYQDTIENVAIAAAIGFGVVVASLGLVLAAVLAIPAAIFAIGYAIGVVLGTIQNFVASAFEAFSGFEEAALGVGGNIIDGLVNGILGGVPRLLAAVGGAVSGAIDAAKSLLGIASPSKVFAEIGGYTAEGFSDGVEAGAPAAQGSMAALVSPASAGAAASAAPASGSSAGARVDLSGATFVFQGIRDAEHAAEKIADALTAVLRGDVESLRGAEVPA